MPETLRILWMNWRDIRHPLAGGAEVYIHEVARRLATRGHEIILLASRPPGLPEREEIDGYTVLRRGGRLTVYPAVRKAYKELKKNGWHPNVVVESINTLPFMAPFYVKEPLVAVIYQLCMDCWGRAIHPLVAPLGWGLEKTLHMLYAEMVRKRGIYSVVTISESTRRDLLKLKYPKENIEIIHVGLDWDYYSSCRYNVEEGKESTVVYLGRIARYKRIEDLILAWKLVEKEIKARLVIAGRPDQKYLYKLRKLVDRLGLRRIEFRLNISENEKLRLLNRAKLLVYTSTREGWGIAVLEAAACHVPTIAYDVPGLRDAVINGETGILVEPGNIAALASAIRRLLVDDNLRIRLAEKAYQRARRFTWDSSAAKFERLLREAAST